MPYYKVVKKMHRYEVHYVYAEGETIAEESTGGREPDKIFNADSEVDTEVEELSGETFYEELRSCSLTGYWYD